MWFFLLALISPTVLGLSQESLEFSLGYFKEMNVPFVCLITCENNIFWNVKFSKAALQRSIAVSSFQNDDFSPVNMKQCFRQHSTTIGVLINAECENAAQIFYFASQNMWLDAMHFWLIIDENNMANNDTQVNATNGQSEISRKVIGILKNLNISVDANIVLALRNNEAEELLPDLSAQYILYDVFNFGKIQGGVLNVTEVGFWSSGTGLQSSLKIGKYYRRWDFGQWPMRMISVTTLQPKDFDPKMLTDLRPTPGVAPVIKTSNMVLLVLAEVHNIRFVHTLTDRWIATYDRNASRVAASSLYFREQDVTAVLRFQLPELAKIDMVHPTVAYIETRYYYRIPTTGPGKFENQFLIPLSPGAWWSLVGVSCLCAALLVLAARLETRPSAVQYGLFSVIASVCQQFFEDDWVSTIRVSAARKLTIFITGVFCVMIYNYYTSSVVSWLLNGPPPSINSLQELLESPLELIYEDIGYTRSWLNTPGYYFNKKNAKVEDDLRRKVLKGKKSTSVIKSYEEGIAMVKAGGYAYHAYTYSANQLISQTFTQSELCELGSLQSMEKTVLYTGMQKNSPYKEFFVWRLTRLLEVGIVSCVQRRMSPRSVSCEGSSPRALALGGAAPAFILLAIGYMMGTGIMLVERMVYGMKQSQNENNIEK